MFFVKISLLFIDRMIGKGGKTWKEITNPMCDFLIHKGLKYRGTIIGMEMIKRLIGVRNCKTN